MDVAETVAMLGGVARLDQLRPSVSRYALDAAVAAGAVHRLARGRYALASADAAHRAGMALDGTVCCLSAAVEHRWPVLRESDKPWIAVPSKRNVPLAKRRGVHLVWSDDPTGAVTSPLRTVLDCLRRLPPVEGLAVADSALRSGTVDHDELQSGAAGLRGPGSGQARRLAAAASPLAANPLESALRALSLDVPGLHLRPQVEIRLPDLGIAVHPDLVDERLRVVVEAEGWLYHGLPEQFARDLERYTALVVAGHLVLRFGHAHLTRQPDWVQSCLESAQRTGSRRANCRNCA